MNQKKTVSGFQTTRIITTLFLVMFLIVRLLDDIIPRWLFGSQIPSWVYSWYGATEYVGIALIVLFRRYELKKMNIDGMFLAIFLLGGTLLILIYLPSDPRILVTLVTLLTTWAWVNGQLSAGQKNPEAKADWWLPLVSLLAILPLGIYYIFSRAHILLSLGVIAKAFYRADLPTVVFEEFLFRGILWEFLKDRGLSDWKVVSVQAIMFWIAHIRFLQNPYMFWFAIPLVGLALGYIVLKTKSIGQSTISHFLYNLAAAIM